MKGPLKDTPPQESVGGRGLAWFSAQVFRRPKAGAIRQEAMDQHQINPAAILATPAEALLDSALSTGTPSFAERILVQAWFCAPPPAVKTRDNDGAPNC